jgi:hypothetical protein
VSDAYRELNKEVEGLRAARSTHLIQTKKRRKCVLKTELVELKKQLRAFSPTALNRTLGQRQHRLQVRGPGDTPDVIAALEHDIELLSELLNEETVSHETAPTPECTEPATAAAN